MPSNVYESSDTQQGCVLTRPNLSASLISIFYQYSTALSHSKRRLPFLSLPTQSSTPPSKMPSVTSQSHPDVPPFPSPSTFSILPDIYLLIARLNILQQATTQTGPSQAESSSQTQQQSQTQTSSTQQQQQPPQHLQTGGPALELKDLPSQVYGIKQHIAKARAAVQVLPDVERSVEEQEREIRELRRTVGLLRGRLGKLAGIAAEGGDVVMKGVEG